MTFSNDFNKGSEIKMEGILSKLLVADNESIQQGTAALREAFKKPGVVLALCNVVVSSGNPQIRQYAAVLLRKRLAKSKHWSKLTQEERTMVKQGILPALVNEPDKNVKNAITQFVGSIMKHELGSNTWPELLQFVHQLNSSASIPDKELGMYILDVLTEIAAKQFLHQSAALCQLVGGTLKNALEPELSSPLVYHAVRVLTNMAPVAEKDQALVNTYHEVLPISLRIVAALAHSDEEKAVKVMEFLDNLLDYVVQVIVPYLKTVIPACLDIAKETSVGDDLRIKALSFIGEVVAKKKKAVAKHNLVRPILDVLFELMCAAPEDDDQEDYFGDENDADTPVTCANQTLDILALHLAPDKVIPPLLEHIEPGLQGEDLYKKKASYLAMAVLAEGCAEYIRSKYLEQFLQCVCKGITDQASIVRNAALFALGQFSEHLQPEISDYAQELLPVLFQYLQQLCVTLQQGEGSKEPAGVDRMFYALEMFCENLGDRLVPHLPTLMESLFIALSPTNSVHLRELAISAVGATANAAKEDMVPYFQHIVESLKGYLMEQQSPETMCLQIQAVDTFGVLARTVGEETFRPLAQESLQLGMALLEKNDDPDLRKSVYGLLASISTVIHGDISIVFPKVIEVMINSIKSQEGILPEYKDEEESAAFPVYEDLSDDTPDEEDIENESDCSDDDLDITCYNVENSYMEEKEEACLALGELAKQAGIAFMPYMDESFDEVLKILNFPHSDIRRTAIDTLTQFCVSLTSVKNEQGQQALLKALSVLVPKCAEIIHTDEDRDVVMAALDSYSELLGELKGAVLVGEGHREAIINCIRDVMTYKTECQDGDDPTVNGVGEDDDDDDAEQDELLIQYAGNVVPQLGKAMTHEDFAQYFQAVLPMFLSKMKKNSSVSQRSFGVGTIAECMEPLGPCAARYASELLPIVMQMSQDEHEEVRNNAIFGLGELALYGKETLYPHYPQILQVLSVAVAKEKNPGTLDNICGALSRLVVTNVEAVPIDDVIPVFVQHLPLRQDFAENRMVFRCLSMLYQMGHKAMLSQIVPVLKIAMIVLYKGQHPDQETLETVVNLLCSIKRDFPAEFNAATSELTPIQLGKLNDRLNAVSAKA